MSEATGHGSGGRPRERLPLVILLTILVGIGAGVGGMAVGLLLHLTQHIAYGYGLNPQGAEESFLEGVSGSPPGRRVFALVLGGIIAGGGWWALGRFGSPVVPIRRSLRRDGPRMPPMTTIVHDLLQVVTVGLGSPLGREAAPRDLGAVFATLLCERAGLEREWSRVLIACGAGAGLAAVYDVPLSGALFTLEVLLGTWAPSRAAAALATSVIATMVAWIGLGQTRQYAVPPLASSPALLLWSLAAGPVLGLAARGFVRLTAAAGSHAARGPSLLPWSIGVFTVIGLLAWPFPQLPGNGRSIAHLAFNAEISLAVAAILLLLRVVIVAAALRAGAHGGLLTPALSIGALLGTIGGVAWRHWWPATPAGAFAIVGAFAFLATSMRMPLTAIALGIEFTGVGHDLYLPIIAAVAGSIAAGGGPLGPGWSRRPEPAREEAKLLDG